MKALLLILTIVASTVSATAEDLPREVGSTAEAIARFEPGSRVRLLNVWATWCAPCVAEMPDLDRLARDLGPLGLDVVGISMDDVIPGERDERKRKVARFLGERKISFENVYFTGTVQEISETLGLQGEIPVTIVFDRTGKELIRIDGPIRPNDLEARLRALLPGNR